VSSFFGTSIVDPPWRSQIPSCTSQVLSRGAGQPHQHTRRAQACRGMERMSTTCSRPNTFWCTAMNIHIYTDGHRVRTSKIFQNLVALQLEPKNFAHLEPWFAKGSDSGGNTNQLWEPHHFPARIKSCHFNLAALLRQCLQTLIAIHFGQNAQREIQKNGKIKLYVLN
jgi:hypothetical protein